MQRTIRNLRRDEQKKHFEMLNLCFKPWGSEEKWRRLYFQPGLDATRNVVVVEENKEWIGGVTAWFREAFLKEGKKVKVYIAGDGYVHPNHRGKGVYSTFMRSVDKLARKKGASLGFGFVSIYGTPFVALPRYGFVNIFRPAAKILILNPEKSIPYVLKRVEAVNFPKEFEDIKVKLIMSVSCLKGRFTISKMFQIRRGKLLEIADKLGQKVDLQISTDVSTLHKIFKSYYLRKKSLYLILFISLLQRRLKLRFSIKFLKKIWGLIK